MRQHSAERGWPGYLLGGRVRTSTVVLLIAFVLTWWAYDTYKPEQPGHQVPAREVVPPGFVPDPAYTWVPRTQLQTPEPPPPSTPEPTTTETTTPTTTTSPSVPPPFPPPLFPPPFPSPTSEPPAPPPGMPGPAGPAPQTVTTAVPGPAVPAPPAG